MKKNKEKNFISSVVYLHNNEKEIKEFVNSLIKVLNENFLKYEIIFVNDYSTDSTIKILKNEVKKLKTNVISIINLSFFQGLEVAMNSGIDLSIGDFVYQFDNVNIDYDMEEVLNIYNISLQGFDIVNAIPNKRMNLSSSIFYKIFNKYSNNQYKITTEKFRIISRRGINRVNSINKKITYRKSIYSNCGLNSKNYVYNVVKNSKNIKENVSNRFNLATNSLLLFTNIAYRVSLFLTFIMMFFALAIGIYTLVIFVKNSPVEGWTTTMLFLSIAFFAIFGLFSIIIKYLSVMLDLIFRKNDCLIESIEKINDNN